MKKYTVKMLKINVMSGVMFETAMRKFASKVCCERHELCLFFVIWSCENAVSQTRVDAKGINTSKAAFEINGYACCRVNRNSVSFFCL